VGRLWMVICIRGRRRRRWKAATAGFNAHASCIFKAPACYSCTRKLNPNARLRSPPHLCHRLHPCVLLARSFSLSLSLSLSFPLSLSISAFSPAASPRYIFASVASARFSLIENQNSELIAGDPMGPGRIRAHVRYRKRCYHRRNVTWRAVFYALREGTWRACP